MSRPLIIAGLAASALHVAVLGSLGFHLASQGGGAPHDAPIALTVMSIAPEPQPLIPDAGEAEESAFNSSEPGEPLEANKPPLADEPSETAALPEESSSAADDAPVPTTQGAAARLDSDPLRTAPTQPLAAPPVPPSASADEAEEVTGVVAAQTDVIDSPPEFLLTLLDRAAQRALSVLASPDAVTVAPAPPSGAPRGEQGQPAIEYCPKPRYPAIARRRGYEGEVLLLVHVQSDGRVGAVTIAQSSGHGLLDRAAARTVREQWRFRSGSLDSRPAAFWIEVPIEFRLTDSD